MNKILLNCITTVLTVIALCGCQSEQENWTHFRGSNLNGISRETTAPIIWNDSVNIAWKTSIEGRGWSSPVVYGNQVWLTSATADGKQMYANCIDFKTGKEVFRLMVFEPEKVQTKHDINTYATPTPCIEKGFVWVHFGTYGTACLSTGDGSVVWKRTDLTCDHVQGPGSSPVLYKDLLILHIEGVDVQYITALNKATGETVWKTDRPADLYEKVPSIGKKAFITPIIVNVNGKDILISNGSAVCIAYDPETGKEIWRIVEGEDSTIAMPFAENGVVYVYMGFVTPKEGDQFSHLYAVDPSGSGDITTTKILWNKMLPVLQLSTPVIKDGLIWFVDSKNNLTCLEASTGAEVYSKRLMKKYNASPVIAAGNIYFVAIDGETLVIKEGRNLEITGRNKLEGEVYATPAILRNSVLIRTGKNLVKISG